MDAFSKHEALDRTFVVMDIFNGYILEHELIDSDPELKIKAEKISDALYDLYNAIGEKSIIDG